MRIERHKHVLAYLLARYVIPPRWLFLPRRTLRYWLAIELKARAREHGEAVHASRGR